jgi:CRISPR-associated protein Cas2
MTVIVLERVSIALRGELSRWMLEVHTGVFVGTLSALVRDLVWDYISSNLRTGAGAIIYQTNTEQGFAMRFCGKTSRTLRDFDGLQLIQIPL